MIFFLHLHQIKTKIEEECQKQKIQEKASEIVRFRRCEADIFIGLQNLVAPPKKILLLLLKRQKGRKPSHFLPSKNGGLQGEEPPASRLEAEIGSDSPPFF